MASNRSHQRIPVRLSHIAEVQSNISPRELCQLGMRQMEPYVRSNDLVTQLSLEQLLKNKIHTTSNKDDLDFDIVRKGNRWEVSFDPYIFTQPWKIERGVSVTRRYTYSDSAVISNPDTAHNPPEQVSSVSWSIQYLCKHKPFAPVVDLFYDCSRVHTELEAVTVTKAKNLGQGSGPTSEWLCTFCIIIKP